MADRLRIPFWKELTTLAVVFAQLVGSRVGYLLGWLFDDVCMAMIVQPDGPTGATLDNVLGVAIRMQVYFIVVAIVADGT